MKAGILIISLPLIKHILKLPNDVKFLKVRQNWEQEQRGIFEVLVEAPNLFETLEGDSFPWVKCTIHNDFCREDEISHIIRSEIESY